VTWLGKGLVRHRVVISPITDAVEDPAQIGIANAECGHIAMVTSHDTIVGWEIVKADVTE
jgi:hypothetical protein